MASFGNAIVVAWLLFAHTSSPLEVTRRKHTLVSPTGEIRPTLDNAGCSMLDLDLAFRPSRPNASSQAHLRKPL